MTDVGYGPLRSDKYRRLPPEHYVLQILTDTCSESQPFINIAGCDLA